MHQGGDRLRFSMHGYSYESILIRIKCGVVVIKLARLDKGGKDGHALSIITNTTNTIILSGHGAPSKLLPVVTPYILLPNHFTK